MRQTNRNMKILALRLEGPMQSWRQNVQWTHRPTENTPTKSGVLGLITKSFGPGANKSSNYLTTKLALHVRIDNPGEVIVDYQTVSGFLPTANGGFKYDGLLVGRNLEALERNKERPSTMIIKKYYLSGAKFLIALTGDHVLLDACEKAVKSPHSPLFLGSKSCPITRPLFDSMHYNTYPTVMDFFKEYNPPKISYGGYIELDDLDGDNLRYDVPNGKQKTVRSVKYFD